jgi:hypothetical protein
MSASYCGKLIDRGAMFHRTEVYLYFGTGLQAHVATADAEKLIANGREKARARLPEICTARRIQGGNRPGVDRLEMNRRFERRETRASGACAAPI